MPTVYLVQDVNVVEFQLNGTKCPRAFPDEFPRCFRKLVRTPKGFKNILPVIHELRDLSAEEADALFVAYWYARPGRERR